MAEHGVHTVLHIQVGVLKQTNLEIGPEQPSGSVLHPLSPGLLAQILNKELNARADVPHIVPAELVHTDLNGLLNPLGLAQILHAPAFSLVVDDLPVGTDDAVKAVGAQELHLVLAEGGAHQLAVLLVLGPCDGVGGHGGSGHPRLAVQVQTAVDEGDQVGLKGAAGIDVEAAGGVVGLPSALGGAVAGEVLHHAVEAVRTPAQVVAVLIVGGLHAADGGVGHIPGQCRILAKGGGIAAPAGLGSHINLGAQQRTEANGAVLLGHLLHGLPGQLGGKGGRQGHVVGVVGQADPPAAVPGVASEHDRDAVPNALHIGLHGVGPLGLLLDAKRGRAILDAPDAVVQSSRLGLIQLRRDVVGQAAVIHHEARDLVGGHQFGQVGRPLVVPLPPVLVQVQLAVAVQILEREAVHLDELHAAVRGVAQGLAALVGHLHPAVGGLFLAPLHLAGAQLLRGKGILLVRHRRGAGGGGAVRGIGGLLAAVAGAQQAQQHGRAEQARKGFLPLFHGICSFLIFCSRAAPLSAGAALCEGIIPLGFFHFYKITYPVVLHT